MQILFNQFSDNLIKQKIYNVVFKKSLLLKKDLTILNDGYFGKDFNNSFNVSLLSQKHLNSIANVFILEILNISNVLNVEKLKIDSMRNPNTENKIKFKTNQVVFNSENNINPQIQGFKIHLDSINDVSIVWKENDNQFVQEKKDGTLQKVNFDSEELEGNFVLKTGDTLLGHLFLIQPIEITNLNQQITKKYVDNLVISIIEKNHDDEYVNFSGIGMDGNVISHNGRDHEDQMVGPLKIMSNPTNPNHQVTVKYVLDKQETLNNHKHNNLYVLFKNDSDNPKKPIKNDFLKLGKHQTSQNELLTLKSLTNEELPIEHEHPYLWNTTGVTDNGELTDEGFYKNVIKQNFKYDGNLTQTQLNNNTINKRDSITKSYLNRHSMKKDYGKLLFGWYDYKQGPGCNPGVLMGQINMLGWYEYYKQNINPNIKEEDFLVIPFFTLQDLQTINRKFMKPRSEFNSYFTGQMGEGSCQDNQSKRIPFLGYLSQTKQVFGHYTHPNPDKKYIIEVQVLSTINANLPYNIHSDRTIGFTMDYSGSMGPPWSPAGTTILMENALRDFQSKMSSDDKGFLVPFRGTVEPFIPSGSPYFIQGGTQLENQVPTRTQDGGTALWQQTYEGLERIVNHDISNNKKIMVVFTDGENNAGNKTLDNCIDYAVLHQIVVYTVGMGSVDATGLQKLASHTGGKYKYGTQQNLNTLYDEVYGETIDLVPHYAVGSYQNYRIYLMGGEIGRMFKYMDKDSYTRNFTFL